MTSATPRPYTPPDFTGVETSQLRARQAALLHERTQLEKRRRAIAEELAPIDAELTERDRAEEQKRRKERKTDET